MKKTFTFKGISIALLLTTIGLIAYLCSRTNSEDSNINPNIQPLNYGALHNEALQNYYQANHSNSLKPVNEYIRLTTEYMKDKREDLFKDVNEQEIISKFKQLEKFKEKEAQARISKKASITANTQEANIPYTDSQDILNFLKENNKISKANYDFLLNNLANDSSLDAKLNSINNYLAKNDLSLEERKQIEIVKSVFISSHEYWSKSLNAKAAIGLQAVAQGGGDKKSRAVIVADAVGALIWWETGPGSIIAGAVTSLIANEGN